MAPSATIDARWYTRDEIIAVFNHPTGTGLTARDNKAINDRLNNRDNRAPAANRAEMPDAWANNPGSTLASKPTPAEVNPSSGNEPPFKMPPETAIAGVLIRDWAFGKVSFDKIDVPLQKGSL